MTEQGSLIPKSSAYGSLDEETADSSTLLTSSLASPHATTATGGGREYYAPTNIQQEGSVTSNTYESEEEGRMEILGVKCLSMRQLALELSLYANLFITVTKLVAYIQTLSLVVLAALLDSVLDVVSQVVLNYTERHSGMQRSSAVYPAGAARLEPIGVLTCAALMGMASFEVLKESFTTLVYSRDDDDVVVPTKGAVLSMLSIVVIKLALLWLCNKGANRRLTYSAGGKAAIQLSDPTLEALAQDHWNDALSNFIAVITLAVCYKSPSLWFLDPAGAILISLYIIHSWYTTGMEQIEHLTGKAAPEEFLQELQTIAAGFDDRMQVDSIKAYHFGPKFLVEIEMVMPKTTLLFESHDLGMELQYEIEGLETVERCFVHIDYETRDYDEHVVSKVPELREKYRPKALRSSQSV